MNITERFKPQTRFIISFLFLMLFSCGNIAGQKQDAVRKYQCQSSACEIVIDGVLDEFDWSVADWSEDFVDIEGKSKPLPPLQTRMKMLWDEQYLYIATTMEEPNLWATLSNRDDIIYKDNDFEVFIDPDGDGLNYYELEINALGTVFDLLMKKPYKQGGKAMISWDFEGLLIAVKLDGTLNNPQDTDQSWTVEMAIPWTAFSEDNKNAPKAGDSWRINFSRVQWELEIENNTYIKRKKKSGKPLAEHNWVWSPQGQINMHIPERWGFIEFIEGNPPPENRKKFHPKYWAWTSENKKQTTAYWDSTFSLMKATGINGVLMSAGPEILSDAICVANKYDIEIHAWFWTMNRGDARPEWLSVNRLGNSLAKQKAYVDYYKFMCPALPEVRSYLTEKIDELTKVKGLKGIHMDYIRYVDAILPVGLQPKYDLVQDHVFPEFDYGYHPYLRKIYTQKTGVDPMEITDPEHDTAWLNFRLAVLDTTVWGIRKQVKNKKLAISAAVFPSPEMSKKMVRQGWDNWGLDYYFPMVYHNFYNESFDWIKEIMAIDKAALDDSSLVFCGLFVPALQKRNDLTKAMEAATEGGADGIAFFNWRAIGAEQREQIRVFIEKQQK